MVNKKNWKSMLPAFLLLVTVFELSPCTVAMQQESDNSAHRTSPKRFRHK